MKNETNFDVRCKQKPNPKKLDKPESEAKLLENQNKKPDPKVNNSESEPKPESMKTN